MAYPNHRFQRAFKAKRLGRAELLTRMLRLSRMKMATGDCAFTLCCRANEKELREVDRVGNSGRPEMSSEVPGAQGKTGRRIRRKVVHCQRIRTCTRCGRHSGETISRSCCVRILVQKSPQLGEWKCLRRNLRRKIFFYTCSRSATKGIRARQAAGTSARVFERSS